MKELQGSELLAALALTVGLVKVIEDGKFSRKVSPAQALLMARGGCYVGVGSPRRVRHLRDVHSPAPWQKCWRTTEAAVFPPSADYFARIA